MGRSHLLAKALTEARRSRMLLKQTLACMSAMISVCTGLEGGLDDGRGIAECETSSTGCYRATSLPSHGPPFPLTSQCSQCSQCSQPQASPGEGRTAEDGTGTGREKVALYGNGNRSEAQASGSLAMGERGAKSHPLSCSWPREVKDGENGARIELLRGEMWRASERQNHASIEIDIETARFATGGGMPHDGFQVLTTNSLNPAAARWNRGSPCL